MPAPLVAIFCKHFDHRLIGAAVQGPPKRGDAGGNGGIEIDPAAADHPYGGGGAVLLVVGMQDPEDIQRLDHIVVNLIGFDRRVEHHVEKIGAVGQIRTRVDDGVPPGHLIGHGRQGPHLGEQAGDGHVDLFFDGLGLQFRVKAAQGIDHAGENPHGVGPVGEILIKDLHVLMHQRGVVEQHGKAIELPSRRQIPLDQEISGLDERWNARQLLHRDATVAQDALLTVHEGDGAGTTAGVRVAAVQCDKARLLPEFGYVDSFFAFGSLDDRQLVGLSFVGERRHFRHHPYPPESNLGSTRCANWGARCFA